MFASASRFERFLASTLALGLVAGCAPVEQRRAEGTSWVVQQEQERQRLQDAGFPQFSGPN
jgi:hypothetical protein